MVSDSVNHLKNLILHVKGALIQFLKKQPIIDYEGSELLLKIVYSMMEFTKEEIEDLKQSR